ncbi:MAG: glucosaminidase domain-containing protein [Candidatus Riflebacteria bacterium]|nr:glucosaminidase domain-containing protein [Candidatus Riflebacteria bacterium]
MKKRLLVVLGICMATSPLCFAATPFDDSNVTPAGSKTSRSSDSSPKTVVGVIKNKIASNSSSAAAQRLNEWKGGKLAEAAFARLFGPFAQEASRSTGVPASIILAQAALESNWGASAMGSAKNLFGFKGTGPAGSVRMLTTEYIKGKKVKVYDNFRKYNTWTEGIIDHGKLISENPVYKNCMKYKKDPNAFALALQKAGYATDPNYAKKLILRMKNVNFYQYDIK